MNTFRNMKLFILAQILFLTRLVGFAQQEDYKKYSENFPIAERIREQLVLEE